MQKYAPFAFFSSQPPSLASVEVPPRGVTLDVLHEFVSQAVGNPDFEVKEQLEGDNVLEPLAELALAAHREQGDEQGAFEQVLRGLEGRTVSAYVASKVGERSASARSTKGLICRMGCSARTTC